MKKTVYILLLMFVGLQTFGQSTEDKAKAAYLKASEEFDNSSYQTCINKLEEAKTFLGKSNARIQYLMAKSYWQLENYKQTKVEVKKYFDYNPKVDEWYKEITELSEKVDKKLTDEKAYNEARDVNKKESYEKYLSNYPDGKFKSNAINELEKFAWAHVNLINTNEVYEKYIADYPNGKHISEAREFVSNYEKKADMRRNPNDYFVDAIKNKDYNLILNLCEYGADPNIVYTDKSNYNENLGIYYSYTAMYIGRNLNFKNGMIYYENLLKYNIIGKGNSSADLGQYWCHTSKTVAYLYIDNLIGLGESGDNIIEAIKLFIKYGWNINSSSDFCILSQATHYHLKKQNYLSLIKYLVDIGLDPNRRERGMCNGPKMPSAYSAAKEHDKLDLIELFEKYKK